MRQRSPAPSSATRASGLLVGATLELFAVETLPFGASRYPEWGSASVIGGALFAKSTYGFDAGRLTTTVLIALTHGLDRRLVDGPGAQAERDVGAEPARRRGARAHDAR